MKEEFVPFSPTAGNMPFCITLAGTSFCDGSYRISRPASPCLCVEYVTKGTGSVFADKKEYHPSAGDIYLLPPGKDHLYFSDAQDPWTKVWFNAEGPLINGLLLAYNPSNTVLFKNCGGYHYFEKIHSIGRSPSLSPPEKHSAAAVAVHELLQFLYSLAHKTNISKEAETMKNYIDSHVADSISLKDLAELVYLSQSQVIRIFRRDFGKTPYDYIIHLKIENAKNLLQNTNLPVKEIALGLNFCDEHYFSYVFRQKTGRTPSAYRKG